MCLALGNLAQCWLCPLSVTRQPDDFIKTAKAGKLVKFHIGVLWGKVCWWLPGVDEERRKETTHNDHGTESRRKRGQRS